MVAKTSSEHRPGLHGGTLRSGNPGNKGGRPSGEFLRHMAQLAESASRNAFMARCLSGKLGYRAYFAALQYASERAWGKPAQPVTGEGGGPVEVRVTRRLVRADGASGR